MVINKNPGFLAGTLYVIILFQFLTKAIPAPFKIEVKIKEWECFCAVHYLSKIIEKH